MGKDNLELFTPQPEELKPSITWQDAVGHAGKEAFLSLKGLAGDHVKELWSRAAAANGDTSQYALAKGYSAADDIYHDLA